MTNKQAIDDKMGDILEAVDKPALEPHAQQTNLLTLTTGVILRVKRVSPLVFQTIETTYNYPPVPRVYDEIKNREIENPAHPDYIKARQDIDAKRALAAIDAILVLGTTIETIPDGFPSPDDEDWLEDLLLLGLVGPEAEKRPRMRYLAWIKFVAAEDVKDIEAISQAILRQTGVPEGDIQAALDSFPRN